MIGADLTRASLELAADGAPRFGLAARCSWRPIFAAPGFGAAPSTWSTRPASCTTRPTRAPRSPPRAAGAAGRNHRARPLQRVRAVPAPASPRSARGSPAFGWFPVRSGAARAPAEPARREAWLRDQYQHPEEHRHTLREVQGWFRENGVEYLRAYPDTQLAAEPLRDDELFRPADDDWGFENVLAQLSWTRTLAHEGGLFAVAGRTARQGAASAIS